jgi:hypothetical protein
MSDDINPSFMSADVLVDARERISVGPVPAWVVSCPFDADFKAKGASQVTHLFVSRQIHAENRQTHYHLAMRLETRQAVQHQSQWQLQFEPRTQLVTLHWIKIRRGEQEFDHTDLGKIRLLQREEGLERFVIHGWCTLLLLLEDVRPDDIIESCYTIETQPRLLPGNFAAFFTLPQGIPVGKFHFSLRFNESRPMKWKSASADLQPTEQRENGNVVWVWTGENYEEPGPEPNTPDWYISCPWIQISDCPDWGTVAVAIAKAWKTESDDTVLAEIAKEIADQEPDFLPRVEKAIQLVQDEYRYLSVNIELGGQVPTAPGIVARKRYGDCKDLSFLLVHLLKRLGISARPILVNTQLRKSLATMLPMDGLFNHAVVEYEVQGQTRWVDATMKQQGGGVLNRFIPDYGVGLPVDLTSTRLIESPRAPVQASRYELKETILLDTTGAPSFISVVLHTKGSHAEVLRQQFEKSGVEGVAGERLQLCTNRFTSAKRIDTLEYRDDRAANEFVLAEVFEINGFLSAHQKQGMCRFRFPNNLVVHTLQMPEKSARRTPFSLPYPCNIVHTVVVEASTLQPMGIRRHNVESPFVKFNRSHKCLHRFWSMTLTLSTLVDAVPPDRIDEHRATVEDIWQRSLWEITLPVGYPHPVKRKDFGSLPPAPRNLTAYIAEPQQNPMPVLPASIQTANGRDMIGRNQPSNQPVKHRRKKHSRHGENRKKTWLPVAIILLILLILVIIIIKFKR